MPLLKTYDIFISHAWKYGDEYDRLITLLDNFPNFKYRNYSAPQYQPLHNLDCTDVVTASEIKDAIQRKIRPVNAVLVISGMYYNYRTWMQYELDTAANMYKPIIAIQPFGNVQMPAAISSKANVIVNWNSSSIVDAIRTYSI